MLEDVLKEIRTAVTTHLPAAFDVEDAAYAVADAAEFGVALVLDDVATIRFEESEELETQEYPALFLLSRGGDESPLMTAQTFLDHHIDCVLVVVDTDPVQLARRLFRSHEALRRVLSERVEGQGVDENPVFQVDLTGWDFSPVFELEEGGLAKAAIQSVTCKEIEARP